MIQLSINLFRPAKKEQVKPIAEDINESIVNDIQTADKKIFSPADLWNIQRRRKNILQRRWSF